MKVKELKERLSMFDDNMDVFVGAALDVNGYLQDVRGCTGAGLYENLKTDIPERVCVIALEEEGPGENMVVKLDTPFRQIV